MTLRIAFTGGAALVLAASRPTGRRPIEVIRPGDRVFFEPGEDNWHGTAPNAS